MTKFTIEITDAASLAGIAAAREVRNAALAPARDESGRAVPIEAHPDYLHSDADYVQHVIAGAASSYAVQFGLSAEEIGKAEADLAARKARLAGVVQLPAATR